MDSFTMRGENGLTTFTGKLAETVVYPGCQRSLVENGSPHDFQAFGIPGEPMTAPLLYCRQCGQVRKLEYEEGI